MNLVVMKEIEKKQFVIYVVKLSFLSNSKGFFFFFFPQVVKLLKMFPHPCLVHVLVT